VNTIFLPYHLFPFPSTLFSQLVCQTMERNGRKAVTRFISIKDGKIFSKLSGRDEARRMGSLRVGRDEEEMTLSLKILQLLNEKTLRFDSGVIEAVRRVYTNGNRIWHNIYGYSSCP
jgi:hypothetical protein